MVRFNTPGVMYGVWAPDPEEVALGGGMRAFVWPTPPADGRFVVGDNGTISAELARAGRKVSLAGLAHWLGFVVGRDGSLMVIVPQSEVGAAMDALRQVAKVARGMTEAVPSAVAATAVD